MTDNLEQGHPQTSTELIMYQLGEIKSQGQLINQKFDQYKSDTDKRLVELEKFQAAQMVQDAIQPKIDVQKIILAAFSLVSTVTAIALGFYNFYR